MEHYVIINEWVNDMDSGLSVIGVTHTFEEAKAILKESAVDERAFAEDKGFEIYEDTDTLFDAGEDGFYSTNHTILCIKSVYVKE
jgi:hypothetical protein